MLLTIYSCLFLLTNFSNPHIRNSKSLTHVEYSDDFLQKIEQKLEQAPSMQSYKGETITFKEYEFIKGIHNPDFFINSPLHLCQLKGLDERKITRIQKIIARFENNYENFIKDKHLYFSQKDSIIEAIELNQATDDQLALILECKKWMMDVTSQEGTWFDLNSLKKHWRLAEIKTIEELADLQSAQLDQAIYANLLNEHIQCKPLGRQPLQIVIEGAGPNGLYAALNLFKAGANVTIINDRGEQYVRNQIIALDPIWMAQLRYFLGTKFNELFKGERAVGSIHSKWKNGEINTKYLEDTLKQCLVELASYIENYGDSTSYLKLLFETTITGLQPLQEAHAGFKIQLESLKTLSANTQLFEQTIFDTKITNFLDDVYQQEDLTLDLKNKQTNFQLVLKERLIGWETKNKARQVNREDKPLLTGDMLICCGGVKDQIRDDYLCLAVPLTKPKNYGIACWNKKRESQTHNFLNENDHYLSITAQQIALHLKEQNLDSLLFQANYLPQSLRQKYANFTQRILNDLASAPIHLRLFENRATFYCGAETPDTLNLFIQEIMQIKSLLIGQQDSFPRLKQYIHYYDLLKVNLEKKWFSAIAAIFGVNDEHVNFDPSPLNTGTFDVIQQSIQVGAKILATSQNSIIITALGDSLASPHFFSGSGMSSGRLGIQHIAKHVKAFHQGSFNNQETLVLSLNRKLEKVKIKVAEKGSRYVKKLSVEQRIEFLKDKMKEKILQQVRLTQGKLLTDLGYQVVIDETFLSFTPVFYLHYLDRQGNKKMVTVELNSLGELISHSPSIKALTFYELLFALI